MKFTDHGAQYTAVIKILSTSDRESRAAIRIAGGVDQVFPAHSPSRRRIHDASRGDR